MSDTITLGNCFKLLAACFYEPDKTLFEEEQVCGNLQNLLAGWADGAVRAAANMALSLKACTQEQLSIDHAALFLGPFELLAPPYGSVYIEKRRQIMGDSTMQVLQRYREAGLTVDVKEAPDHIAIELEFMNHLCMKQAESESAGDIQRAKKYWGLQNQFYHYALCWVPQFCSTIRESSNSPFYMDLANCLERFMLTCGQVYGKQIPKGSLEMG